jgi:hypothetical protein
MIVPVVGVPLFSNNEMPAIGDQLQLIKETDDIFSSDAIGVYFKDHKIGFLSRLSTYNLQVFERMTKGKAYGIVYALFPTNILVELDPRSFV